MNTLAGIEASHKHFVAGDFESEAVPDRVWSQALDAYGHIDVLVLNAAMMVPADDVEDSGDAWHSAWNRHYRVNVLAPARLIHQAVRHFQSRGGGVIIVLSSWVAQRGVTNPRMLAYAASKSAAFSRSASSATENALIVSRRQPESVSGVSEP